MTTKPTQASARVRRDEAALAKHAMSYPEVNEEAPWGHRAFKVKGKTFLFMGADGDGLGLSTKLPMSATVALSLPFAEPTHYGLGKSGWVSAKFAPSDEVPLELMREWIDESYRAIAPKKLLARIGEPAAAKAELKPKLRPKAKPLLKAPAKRSKRKARATKTAK